MPTREGRPCRRLLRWCESRRAGQPFLDPTIRTRRYASNRKSFKEVRSILRVANLLFRSYPADRELVRAERIARVVAGCV